MNNALINDESERAMAEAIGERMHVKQIVGICQRLTLMLLIALSAIFVGHTNAQPAPRGEAPQSQVPPPKPVSINSPTTSAAQAQTPAPTPAHAGEDGRYRIGEGDVINVQVFNRTQLSREAVRVDGRGMIRMPWIDDEIKVACRTEEEVAGEITERYRRLLRNPQVGVFIKEYQSQPVAVIGAVNQPGRFQLQRRVRLLELLTFAGGPAERAGRSVQIIHAARVNLCDQQAAGATSTDNAGEDIAQRGEAVADARTTTPDTVNNNPVADTTEDTLTSYSLSEVLRGDSLANPSMQPGDIVTIPDADQVFVVGNVLKPSTLTLRERLTVTQAIAMAGGLQPDSQSGRVRIVRQTDGGKKTEIYVDLKAVEKQRAEDVALQANDIVDVPIAGGKRFLRTIVSAIAPAVGQLPVRVIP